MKNNKFNKILKFFKLLISFLMVTNFLFFDSLYAQSDKPDPAKSKQFPGGSDEDDLEVLKELEPIDRKISNGELAPEGEMQEIEEF